MILIIKITMAMEALSILFLGWWLLVSEPIQLAYIGLATSGLAAIVTIFTLIFQYKTRAEVKQLKINTDGKMTELLAAATGKAAAEATVVGKDELIEVLKQVEPLKTGEPIDVIVKNDPLKTKSL